MKNTLMTFIKNLRDKEPEGYPSHSARRQHTLYYAGNN